ncbi:sarcosine oxidase subunit delta [Sphingobium sp. HBC34]|uniref:Sarcosine oxidase subunit delta n=1 Tax=Sphingobium cyanobacteriorum TaxID=3063954 RepID=A0ABT8ZM96_9SPHN|nr:sarcosine oxidase subunit delta [Sphingobium sp. HBC34]MDO7835591.1 sarcosine oxidase subunit delta [Sphingobium sp. HBC34]
MLRLSCPFCGPRDEREFHCGGQSHIQRPGPAEAVSDASWGSYLFDRINPRGHHAERWHHSFGCGRWFNVLRDTTTHHILAVYAMTEPVPDMVQSDSVA